MLIKNRMHPKNIYKTPPNFKELAINFPEFRKYVKQDLSGKLIIDYQNPNAVKELTKTLLKKDFDLEVEIDESRLIPRVPLCLNYILWIEDLLGSCETQVLGVDIGTGCACIYSLLSAKKGWKMLATEVDEENYKNAQRNVARNNLQDQILVKLVPDSKQLLVGVLEDKTYDFCMCNPPFFTLNEKPQNRTNRRPILSSVASDVSSEISVEGGEVNFITQLIEESVRLKEQIKIYTTLVGKKSDFLVVKKELQKASPKSVTYTEFCQGRTTRWGLAWTFSDISLKEKSKPDVDKNKKGKAKPLQFTVPKDKAESLEIVYEDVKKVLDNLKINYSEESFDFTISFKAFENTWSHQRRKKRLKARNNEQPLEEASSVDEETEASPAKKLKLDEEASGHDTTTVIVEGLICLKSEESLVVFEMSWVEGGKESLHQIFQYFKNYWSKSSTQSGDE